MQSVLFCRFFCSFLASLPSADLIFVTVYFRLVLYSLTIMSINLVIVLVSISAFYFSFRFVFVHKNIFVTKIMTKIWVFIKDILSNRYRFIYTHSIIYTYYSLYVCLYIDIYCTFIYIFIICLFVIYKSSSLAWRRYYWYTETSRRTWTFGHFFSFLSGFILFVLILFHCSWFNKKTKKKYKKPHNKNTKKKFNIVLSWIFFGAVRDRGIHLVSKWDTLVSHRISETIVTHLRTPQHALTWMSGVSHTGDHMTQLHSC